MDNQHLPQPESQSSHHDEKASRFGKHPFESQKNNDATSPVTPPPFNLGDGEGNPSQLSFNTKTGSNEQFLGKRYVLNQIALRPIISGNFRIDEANLFLDSMHLSGKEAGTSPGVNYTIDPALPGNIDIITDQYSYPGQLDPKLPLDFNGPGSAVPNFEEILTPDSTPENEILASLQAPSLEELFPQLQTTLVQLLGLNTSSFSENVLTWYREEFSAMAPNPGLEVFAHDQVEGIREIWNQTYPLVTSGLSAFGIVVGETPAASLDHLAITILATDIFNNLQQLYSFLNKLLVIAQELTLLQQQGGGEGTGIIAEIDQSLLMQLGGDKSLMENYSSDLRPHSNPDLLQEIDSSNTTSKTQFVVSLLSEYAMRLDLAEQVYDHLSDLGLDPNAERDRILYGDGTYLNGTDGDDILIGGDGDNVIAGLKGNDIIFGAGGDDVLLGDWGNNTIFGMDGSDIIDAGIDGDNIVFGGDGIDYIYGGSGDETIYGEGGSDYIYAGAGNDEIHGGDEDDYIDAGLGNDTIYGGDGENTMIGGELGEAAPWELTVFQINESIYGTPLTEEINEWRGIIDQAILHPYGNSLAKFLLDDLATQFDLVMQKQGETSGLALGQNLSDPLGSFPFSAETTGEGTSYFQLVEALEISRKGMLQLKEAIDDYMDNDPDLIPLEELIDGEIDARISINHEKLELLDPHQVIGYEPNAHSGEQRHRELAGSFRISENPNAIQKTVGVELKFNLNSTLSGEEFKRKVLFNLFGPGEHVEYDDWTPDRSSYTPSDSPVGIWVNNEELVNNRLDIARDQDIPLDEPNRTYEGHQERFDAFFDSEEDEWKNALREEIDTRWLALTNREANGPDGVDSFGDVALYSQIMDEVFYQQEVLNNLSTDVFNFIDQVTDNLTILPADFEQWMRIVGILDPLTAVEISNFLDTHGEVYSSLDVLEAKVNEFIGQTFENQIIESRNDENISNLAGLGDIYTEYLELRREQLNLDSIRDDPEMAQQAQLIRLRILELETNIEADLTEAGVADMDEFVQFINDFEISFEEQARVTAQKLLARSKATIAQEKTRYEDLNVITQLIDDAFLVTRGDSEYEGLSQTYPVFYDEKFPTRLQVDLNLVNNGSEEEVQTHLLDILNQREAGMSTVEGNLAGNSGYIYKLQSQQDQFFAEQGIETGSIQYRIIQNKIYRDQVEDIAFGIGIGLISMGLAALTGGGSLVASAALIGTLGFDGYFIYQDYQNYVEDQAIAGAGWGDDPSVVWLGLSVMGAVVDLAEATRLIKILKPSAKVLYETGDIAPFQEALETVGSNPGHRMLAPGTGSRGVASVLASLAQSVKTWHDTGEELRAAIKSVPADRNIFKFPPVKSKMAEMAANQRHSPEPDFGEFFEKVKTIVQEEKSGYVIRNSDYRLINDAWKNSRRGGEVFKLPTVRPENLESITTDIIGRVKNRIDLNKAQFLYNYEGKDDRVREFVAKGIVSGLSHKEIEDLLYVGSRRSKRINLRELWNQVDYFGYIKYREFPAKFDTKAEYDQFGAFVRSNLRQTSNLQNYGLGTEDIRIIGSAVRKPNPGDIDVDILTSSQTYYKMIKDGFGDSISRVAGPGTHGPINLANLSVEEIEALGLEMIQSGNHFDGPVSSFRQVITNKRISSTFSQQSANHLVSFLNLENFRNLVKTEFPKLPDISFTIKKLDSPDSFRSPFMHVPAGNGGGLNL